MGLTNAQYDLIMAHYDQIRLANHDIQKKRDEEIHNKLPEYEKSAQSLRSIRKSILQASLDKNEALLKELKETEQACIKNRDDILEQNGYPRDYLSTIYTCPICKDTGFLPDTRKKCSCFIKFQTKLLFEQSGIMDLLSNQNFSTISFDYFNEEEADSYKNSVRVSLDFIKSFNTDYHNLLFYGNVGTGKTFLSCCIAKELMEKGISVAYYSADQLFKNFVDYRFMDDKDTYYSFLDELNERDLLIIDDLGTESVSERVRADLFTLLNNRDLAQKSTIISTNLSLDDLSTRYSERVMSRIGSHFELCKFEGRDIRMIKKVMEKEREDHLSCPNVKK